ncbi:flavin reductase domain protein [Anaeramoeba ignava]|uniref:Flavin reductase domain protein n=1 Tax=Anaeramoeba ignava TaxID=1746090 RepID=A0A9Q0LAQ8_ANAIG|nr:flavin reductase domain protein [Anaeramoeba ignava]|eukprot:Anaeramoba_ignava/a485889_7.p1 GENE.a485889_7~~a485889_7.p1  ORF type:complete len:193 (-),score=54.91 a485889_7:39-617(-)
MSKKIEIPNHSYYRLINTGPVILGTFRSGEKQNITTFAWTTPLSKDPPLLGIALAPERYSYELIKESNVFCVNVPNSSILSKVFEAGNISGRDYDKFKLLELDFTEAEKVNCPLLTDCIGNIECEVQQIVHVGDHYFFIGEVKRAIVSEEIWENNHLNLKKENGQTVHHLGDQYFTIPNQITEAKFFSREKK